MQNRKNPAAPPVTGERGKDHEVIRPKNLLKRKAAVPTNARPESTRRPSAAPSRRCAPFAPQFNGWMEDAARKLADKWRETREHGYGEGRLAALHRDAHDIRGQATTLGFPLSRRSGRASACCSRSCLPPGSSTMR